jgi:beta-N-acetylhexosaminidase
MNREYTNLTAAAGARPLGGAPLPIVVMGVSGCGKSTVGLLVARELGARFLDGDSLHPVENVAKMAAGTPLSDEDRWPWLATVASELAGAGTGGLVLACSALRRNYRDAIREKSPDTLFLHLHGSKEVLAARMEIRTGHFMPAALLDSQLATLEELDPDEAGVIVDIASPVDQVVDEALIGLHAWVEKQMGVRQAGPKCQLRNREIGAHSLRTHPSEF